MAKITIKGYINAYRYSSGGDTHYQFNASELNAHGFVPVMPYEFDVEIPDSFNMAAAQVSSLENTKEQLRKEFNCRIAQINEQISKLQCLEFVPKETV